MSHVHLFNKIWNFYDKCKERLVFAAPCWIQHSSSGSSTYVGPELLQKRVLLFGAAAGHSVHRHHSKQNFIFCSFVQQPLFYAIIFYLLSAPSLAWLSVCLQIELIFAKDTGRTTAKEIILYLYIFYNKSIRLHPSVKYYSAHLLVVKVWPLLTQPVTRLSFYNIAIRSSVNQCSSNSLIYN